MRPVFKPKHSEKLCVQELNPISSLHLVHSFNIIIRLVSRHVTNTKHDRKHIMTSEKTKDGRKYCTGQKILHSAENTPHVREVPRKVIQNSGDSIRTFRIHPLKLATRLILRKDSVTSSAHQSGSHVRIFPHNLHTSRNARSAK